MNILLKRTYKSDTYTIGKLYVNNEYFSDTLEDRDRGLSQSMKLSDIIAIKVRGQTAIPLGTYIVKWTFSNRFQRYMPLVMDVPGFEGIRIHSGNSNADTEGCILVGENKIKGKVINSRVAVNRLYNMIQKADDSNEKITITIM